MRDLVEFSNHSLLVWWNMISKGGLSEVFLIYMRKNLPLSHVYSCEHCPWLLFASSENGGPGERSQGGRVVGKCCRCLNRMRAKHRSPGMREIVGQENLWRKMIKGTWSKSRRRRRTRQHPEFDKI